MPNAIELALGMGGTGQGAAQLNNVDQQTQDRYNGQTITADGALQNWQYGYDQRWSAIVPTHSNDDKKFDEILKRLERTPKLEEMRVLLQQYKSVVGEHYMYKTKKEERELLTKLFDLVGKL